MINELKEEIIEMKSESKALETEESKIRQYTDDEIIEIVKAERSFNCPSTPTKDFFVRRSGSNLYLVRFYQNIF